MLRNTKEDKYHPIVFEESPLPGPPSDNKIVRHKSKMHHTSGFDTRQEALDSIDKMMETEPMKKHLDEDKDFDWDGEGVPALVKFFLL